jgi:hypothetical protein
MNIYKIISLVIMAIVLILMIMTKFSNVLLRFCRRGEISKERMAKEWVVLIIMDISMIIIMEVYSNNSTNTIHLIIIAIT